MSDYPELAGLSQAERADILARYYQLQPYLEGVSTLQKVVEIHGLKYSTAQRWVKRYHQEGLLGLARRQRRDKGQYRIQSELVTLIEGLALKKPPPTLTAIHRKVVQVAEEQDWFAPSYGTVRNIVQALDGGMLMLAQQGTKAYQEAYDLLYQRDATVANEIWQADHCLLKIYLLNAQNKPARPWLTVILDDYSRAVAGYQLSFAEPTALQTALALRRAIWRKEQPQWHVCGIPETFYTDHGSDFTSQHMEQVAADIKMQLVFSTVGMPRGRGRVERFFGTVLTMLLPELPGYAPQKRLDKDNPPKLTLDAFDELLEHFVLHTYHERIHGTTNQLPQAMWSSAGFVPRMPDSLEQLDLLLLTVPKIRIVRQEGIRFNNLWYVHLTLAAYVKESVVIRYDPRDMAEIRVYHNNQFLCRAICHDLAGITISLKEIMRQRNARRRQLKQAIETRRSVVARYWQNQPETDSSAQSDTPSSHLKRYFNE